MLNTTPAQIAAVRRFNRVWTRYIGVLNESVLDTPWSLTEARVLYELAHQNGLLATELAQSLGLDQGYLSRIISRFTQRGLIERTTSPIDARRAHLQLTDAGRTAFATLDNRQEAAVDTALAALGADGCARLVAAMSTVERLIEPSDTARSVPGFVLRQHRVGDLGWVVWRHGVIYAREYAWDERFEGMVAGVICDFADRFDPLWEQSWIAERDGTNVGCVFLVRESERVAKLRMLLVEPAARGLGVGRTLVAECLRFARARGYTTVTLMTNALLLAARRIYQAEGFRLVAEERKDQFGKPDGVWQTWELTL